MLYKTEREMYPAIIEWLSQLLKNKFPSAQVEVADTSRVALNSFITNHAWQSYFKPEWVTYDIHVDVTGIIIEKGRAQLAFVECKLASLTLSNLSQLLGYSRVALPLFSFIISPNGCSDAVISLIQTYSRTDILEYHWERGTPPRTLILATWSPVARQVEPATILPRSAASMFALNT
jgi:hypothetical protein